MGTACALALLAASSPPFTSAPPLMTPGSSRVVPPQPWKASSSVSKSWSALDSSFPAHHQRSSSESQQKVVLWSRNRRWLEDVVLQKEKHAHLGSTVGVGVESGMATRTSCIASSDVKDTAAKTAQRVLQVDSQTFIPLPLDDTGQERLLVRAYGSVRTEFQPSCCEDQQSFHTTLLGESGTNEQEEHGPIQETNDTSGTPTPSVCCVCVPLQALVDYATSYNGSSTAMKEDEANPWIPIKSFWRYHTQKQYQRRKRERSTTHQCSEMKRNRNQSIPMILVFTRGFTADGETPATLIHRECAEEMHSCMGGDGVPPVRGVSTPPTGRLGSQVVKSEEATEAEEPAVAILTVCGPVVPQEWAIQSSSALSPATQSSHSPANSVSHFSGTSLTVTLSSSAWDRSSYPQDAGEVRGHFDGPSSVLNLRRRVVISCPSQIAPTADSLPYPHNVLVEQVSRVFPRENVSYVCSLALDIDDPRPEETSRSRQSCRRAIPHSFRPALMPLLLGLEGPLHHLYNGLDVVGIVNGCLPLVAFGAGLVQAAYASTGTTSALISYAQNASNAMEALLRDVEEAVEVEEALPSELDKRGSRRGQQTNGCVDSVTGNLQKAATPFSVASLHFLPPSLVSSIYLACLHHSSKEFVLGRQMDFHFRKEDALRAVFRRGPRSLRPARSGDRRNAEPVDSDVDLASTISASADGLYEILLALNKCDPAAASPLGSDGPEATGGGEGAGIHVVMGERKKADSIIFFEALLDTFHTVLRASSVGQGLVKAGYEGFRSPVLDADGRPTSPLLREIMNVDEAMLSGSEEALKQAAAQLVERFRPATMM